MISQTTIPIAQNISTAQAVEVLAANGLTVSAQQAAEIIKFLYTLAGTSTSKQ